MSEPITLYLHEPPLPGSFDGPTGEVTLQISSMPVDIIAEHLAGLRGYLQQFEQAPIPSTDVDEVVGVIGIVAEPTVDAQVRELLRSVVARHGGFVFWGGQIYTAETLGLVVDLPGARSEDDQERNPVPPTADRVAKRALALAAVICRSFMEQDPEAAPHLPALSIWAGVHCEDELEDEERALLSAGHGTLNPQRVSNGTWRSEGLVVLAWALGVGEMPAHDEESDPAAVSEALGLWMDELPEATRSPTVRGAEELAWMKGRLLGLHWRMVDYRVAPRPVDFAAFSKDCWFGGFDLTGVQLVGDDLAIDGVAISQASPDAVGRTSSVAVERHQAINWLLGYDSVYSEVDTST